MGVICGYEQEKPVDTWQADEIDTLRNDVLDLEQDVEDVTNTLDIVTVDLAIEREAHKELRDDLEEKIKNANQDLYTKSLVFLDLIAEYDDYLKHARIPMDTQSKIDSLKQRGGLIV